jgi:serine/threonine protein kinase
MMSAPPGYTLGTILHNGDRTLVYRSIRECDQKTVIIKTLKTDFPTIEQTARLKQEYQILRDLPLEGVIKPYKLKQIL